MPKPQESEVTCHLVSQPKTLLLPNLTLLTPVGVLDRHTGPADTDSGPYWFRLPGKMLFDGLMGLIALYV